MRDNFIVALVAAAFTMLVIATAHLKHIRESVETIESRMEVRR